MRQWAMTVASSSVSADSSLAWARPASSRAASGVVVFMAFSRGMENRAPGGRGRWAQRLAVLLSQLGSLNTQKDPPWATGRVRSAMSPPHSGTAPP